MDANDGKTITLAAGDATVETYYYELGPAGGQPVVFMQTGGAGTSSLMCWYHNLDYLADAGFHVFAPDAPGFGRSKVVGEGAADAVEFLRSFLDAMGVERAHLVGNSMGAMTSARFAVAYPERTGGVVLSGGEPRAQTDEARAIAPTLGATPRMDFVRQMLGKARIEADDMRHATADFFFDRENAEIEVVSRLRMESLLDPDLLRRTTEEALGQVARGRSNFDSSMLQQIQAPTFLLQGRDEKWFYTEATAPALIRAAVELTWVIPDCRCTLLPHCAHWPQLEQPDTYNALVVNFLSEHVLAHPRGAAKS
jgi:pimeloyl-ACP methyl ester carboxylesterase